MHGLTEEAYQEELAKARAEGDGHRVSVLQGAKDIVERFEFHDMHSLVDLKLALASAQQKVMFIETVQKADESRG